MIDKVNNSDKCFARFKKIRLIFWKSEKKSIGALRFRIGEIETLSFSFRH